MLINISSPAAKCIPATYWAKHKDVFQSTHDMLWNGQMIYWYPDLIYKPPWTYLVTKSNLWGNTWHKSQHVHFHRQALWLDYNSESSSGLEFSGTSITKAISEHIIMSLIIIIINLIYTGQFDINGILTLVTVLYSHNVHTKEICAHMNIHETIIFIQHKTHTPTQNVMYKHILTRLPILI